MKKHLNISVDLEMKKERMKKGIGKRMKNMITKIYKPAAPWVK